VALRWFVLAVPLMFLVFMLMKGLSRPARRLLPGAAGQCLEEVKVVTERVVQSRPWTSGRKTRASRKEEDPGGSAKDVVSHGIWCCGGAGDEGGFWGFCGLVSLIFYSTRISLK
jgi:hypothetical protein